MVRAGKCKNIGVSNFTKEQLDHLCSVATIPPAVNQVELHPYFQQQDLMGHCEKAGSEFIVDAPCCFPCLQSRSCSGEIQSFLRM